MADRENDATLPYIHNGRLALLVAGINVACSLVFQYGSASLPLTAFVVDGALCGVITSFCTVFLTQAILTKMRRRGVLPAHPPHSALMRRLPRNPWRLACLFALCFGPLTALLCWCAPAWYGLGGRPYSVFLAWKLLYSLAVAILLQELAVLRYVQTDCAAPGDPPQRGAQAVKNPLPTRELCLHLYTAVTTDFGLNLLIGLLFGGVVIQNKEVVILATTHEAIIFTGPILGAIITVLMVLPVGKSVWERRQRGELVSRQQPRPWDRLLPATPARFAWLLAVPVMLAATLTFAGVFHVFQFAALDFFQFFFIRSLFVMLLARPLVWCAVCCCRRPGLLAGEAVQGRRP